MRGHKHERIESRLVKEISYLILRSIKDPRIQGVHVVSVKLSPDHHLARVYYSTLNESSDVADVQRGLDSAKGFMRSEIRKTLPLKVIPEIAFFFDPSIREGDRILGILRELDKEKQKPPQP
ncbi:30S ribosome-binding factor RbfA [bacterium]|nr:30S ribosome-binding factor RbfA [bacterium]